MEFNAIEMHGEYIYTLSTSILKILLKDKTTKRNIIWATDDYSEFGASYTFYEQIYPNDIVGMTSVIKPRVVKGVKEQSTRIRGMAEVFTPAWVCNKQNNIIDEAWFGRKNVFNEELESGWRTTAEKIVFPNEKGKSWQDYVKANRLEITCGEAPYLTSRYDASCGNLIPVKDRIGLLDRKLRIISENVDSEPEWFKWAKVAVQSIYGFDWQGDNVLLARENLLFTFMDYYFAKFQVPAIKEYLVDISRILAWNIWQMDGIKYVVPGSCKDEISDANDTSKDKKKITKCLGCQKNDHSKHNGIYCRIYDWNARRSVEFYSFIRKGKEG